MKALHRKRKPSHLFLGGPSAREGAGDESQKYLRKELLLLLLQIVSERQPRVAARHAAAIAMHEFGKSHALLSMHMSS